MKFVIYLQMALLLTFLPSAEGKQCKGGTCIGVTTDEKSVIITVQKGKPGSEATTKPKPLPSKPPLPKTSKAPLKPKILIPYLPKVSKPKPNLTPNKTPKPTPKPKPKVTVKPRVKKIKASSLSEQVRQLLPGGAIAIQPTNGALRGEPVNFMTSVPNRFQTVLMVLDVPIRIDLRANYIWDFGDGSTISTFSQGAPYPLGTITHSYKSEGAPTVRLLVTWSGTWSSGGISGPINGVIRQNFQESLKVHAANTDFTN
ncbi:MAG: PKD domain-containing protein [Actinomycetota bacterium]